MWCVPPGMVKMPLICIEIVQPFEVVLVQYGMPRKHGIDVALEILKQDPTNR